jgi:hypothetical protein
LTLLSRLDMRALNSGRRWGSDVPTFKDILHAVGVLYDRFQQRSTVLTSICDQVEGVSKNFAKVTNNFQTFCSGTKKHSTRSCVHQVENKTDSTIRQADGLLAAFEGSHPLVPRRKQSAYELERGPIYPETESEKWTCILQEGKKSRMHHQSGKKPSLNSSPNHMIGNLADAGIRTDPSLEVIFTAQSSDTSSDGRQQPFRRKMLGSLNPT